MRGARRPIVKGTLDRRAPLAQCAGRVRDVIRIPVPRRRVAAAALALCAVLVPATGVASASAATSGYRITTTRLPDGRTVAVRWNPCQTITYKVNVAAVPAARRAATLAEVRKAVSKVRAATGMRFTYRGTTSEVPRTNNLSGQSAELIVAVVRPSSTDFRIGGATVGYGGILWAQWASYRGVTLRYGAAVVRGYVVMDVGGFSRLSAGFGGGQSQGNALLHELAHAVGLDHATSRRQLMYPILRDSSPRGFASGDRAGLVRVGRRAGCISIPANVTPRDLSR